MLHHTCSSPRWDQLLDHVRRNHSETVFENWFSVVHVVGEDETSITIEVPNPFVEAYLLENFQEEMDRFIGKNVVFRVATFCGENSPPPRKEIRVGKACSESSEAKRTQTRSNKTTPSRLHPQLHPQYTFPRFIEGPENQFVKACAMGIGKKLQALGSPLFAWGNVGLGKTHLLHAIGHQCHSLSLSFQYITTEAFINHLVSSLGNRSVGQMKRLYRSLDVLLLDDIQFLQNRKNFEDELIHTLESLYQQGKQVVIVSDTPPSKLQLSQRMIGRLEGGLLVEMQMPGVETRAAILQAKLEEHNLSIDRSLSLRIASHPFKSIRQLEGIARRMAAHTLFLQKNTVTEEIAENALSSIPVQPIERKLPSPKAVVACVSDHLGVPIQEILGSSRKRDVSYARHLAVYCSYELCGKSLVSLAQFFNKRHSTLAYAISKLKKDTPSSFERDFISIKTALVSL